MEKLDFGRDYYADLQLPHIADLPEIRTQYRKLALKYHPDRNPGRESVSAAKFGIIEAAYKVLSDPATKQQYDNHMMRKRVWPTGDSGSSSRGTTKHNSVADSNVSISATSASRTSQDAPVKVPIWSGKARDPAAKSKVSEETTARDSDSAFFFPATPTPINLPPVFLTDILSNWGAVKMPGLWGALMDIVNSMFELSDVLNVLGGHAHHKVASVNCEWQVPYQIRKAGYAKPDIKGFLMDHKVLVAVNTGGDQLLAKLRVEATTCSDYVKRNMGEKGYELLADLENALSGNTLQESYRCHQVKTITYNEDKIFITLRPDVIMDRDDLWSISNTLAWVCSAVRTETDGPHVLSSTLCNVGLDNKDITLNLSVHDISLPHIENNCWLPLFEVSVVSLGPRQSVDNQFKESGRGLKVSFDLLLQLSAVEYPVKVNDKIMLVGYQTALLPIQSEPSYVQFHLIVDEENQVNPYTLDSSNCIPWDDNAVAEFRSKDCYIGWCGQVHILLGTGILSTATIKYSDAPMKEKTLRLDGFGAGLQAASTAPLQAGGSLQANFKYQTNRLRFTPSGVFSHFLLNASKELAFVYDPTTKRAWIVPKLNLLLHMFHTWREVNNIKKGNILYLPSHMTLDIVKFLECAGSMIVCGDGNDALSFRSLLLRFNLNLLQCFENTEEAKERLFSGVNLYGFDFMDIITEPGRGSCMRAVSLGPQAKAWLPLVKLVDALVICSGIGDVIRAEATPWNKQTCVNCATPPSGRDCLTTTVQCLKTIVLRNGKEMPEILKEPILDISNDKYLVLGERVFRECDNKLRQEDDEACWDASRFQHLETRKKMGVVLNGKGNYQPQELRANGAIVLGCSNGQ